MNFRNIAVRGFISLTIIVFAWTSASAQSEAEAIVESWLKSALGFEFVEITYDNLSHNNTTGITSVNDLAISFSANPNLKPSKNDGNGLSRSRSPSAKINYKITFPEIKFENLAFDGSYYSAKSIATSRSRLDFQLSGAGASNSTSKGTYGELSIKNIRWSKIPEISDDPNKPISKYFPLVEALLDISFENARVGGMDMEQQIEQPKPAVIKIHYGPMEIGKTIKGNFSNIIMDGVEMVLPELSADAAADASGIKVIMGKISAKNYNYGTFLESFRPGNIATTDNGPYTTFLGEMIFEGMDMTSKKGTFSMGNIITKDIGIRAPKIDLLTEADKLYLDTKENGAAPDEQKLVELIANIYGTIRLGLFEMQDLIVDVPGNGKGGVGLYKIADLSAAGFGEFLLKSTYFDAGPENKLRLDEFTFGDLKFPSLTALLNLETAIKENNYVQILKAIPTLGYYSLKGLKANLPGQGKVSLGEATVKMREFIGPIPTQVEMLVKDIVVPVDQLEPAQRDPIRAMGFEEVQMSLAVKAKWDEDTSVVSVESGMEVVDGGIVDMDVAIGSIPRQTFENPLKAQEVIAFATIDKANITFDDRSIVDRGLKLAGAMQGMNADTMKAQAVGMLPIILQQLDRPAFVDQLVAAVNTLLATKGTITVTAAPASPILILQLMGAGASAPGAVIDLLDVNVSAQ